MPTTRSKMRCTIVALACCLSGCATANWSTPVSEFNKAVEGSVVVVGAFYEGLNNYERHLYLQGACVDPEQEIRWRGQDASPTPLAGRVFSVASVKARKDALQLVGTYAQRLASLAGSASTGGVFR